MATECRPYPRFAKDLAEIETERRLFAPNYHCAFTNGARFAAACTSTAAFIHNADHFYSRGLDVKNILASHLYCRLILHGLSVYMDYQGLEEGDNLISEIEDAITTASSLWCLNELLLTPLFLSFTVSSILNTG